MFWHKRVFGFDCACQTILHTSKHVGEIFEGVDRVRLAGGDDRVESGYDEEILKLKTKAAGQDKGAALGEF